MKNIKRFEIDVLTTFGGDYDEFYPLKITDLRCDYSSAIDGTAVAEIAIEDGDDARASFQLGLEEIESLFDVLTHIRAKVLEQKKPEMPTE